MKTLKIIALLIAVVIVIGALGFSTWNQWIDNQKTTQEEQNHITPIAEFNQGIGSRQLHFLQQIQTLLQVLVAITPLKFGIGTTQLCQK